MCIGPKLNFIIIIIIWKIIKTNNQQKLIITGRFIMLL